MSQLFAFAPVYNEAGSIRQVATEWVEAFRRLGIPATLLLLDDGSTDATPTILEELRRELPELQVVRHSNRGHGPSCTQGYQRALASVLKQSGDLPGAYDRLVFAATQDTQDRRLAFEIATASPRVAYFGGGVSRSGDIARSIGYRWTPEGTETLFLRSKVLVDARAAGGR